MIMKKLSIEQKAQRYDEAIERARQLLIDGCSNYDKETIWNIFPELKESEDEKVIKSINRLISHYYDVNFPTPEGFTREELVSWLKKQIDKQQSKSAIKEEKVEDEKMKKELISFVRGMLACHDKPNAERDEKYESWIAWLEKQGEHANFISKIQVGDKVTRNDAGVLVNLSQLNRVAKKECEMKEIIPEDATVDSNEDGLIAETIRYKKEKQDEQKSNSILDIDIPFGAKDSELQEASYYIPEGFHAEIEGNRVVIKRGEQKPADTKEYDFHGIKFIPKFKEGDVIRDKKRGETTTIRDFSYDTGLYTHTYGQFPITIQDDYEKIKPIAWSKEDERIIYNIEQFIHLVKNNPQVRDDLRKEAKNWLKSLKDRVQLQSQWKPSTDQLAALFCAIPYIHCSSTRACACSLYNDLRKLMKI